MLLASAKVAYAPVQDDDDEDQPVRFVRLGIRVALDCGTTVFVSDRGSYSVEYPAARLRDNLGQPALDSHWRPVYGPRRKVGPMSAREFRREFSASLVRLVALGERLAESCRGGWSADVV